MTDSSGTQTVQRAVTTLRAMAAKGNRGVRLSDLARRANLTIPTTHRILRGLVAEGLVKKDEQSHRYFLGPLLFEFGLAAQPSFDIRKLCRPTLQRLAEEFGDTVYLIVRSGVDAVCYDRQIGSFPIKVLTQNVGNRRPLGIGAGGIAMIISLEESKVKEIIAANANQFRHHFNLSARSIANRVNRSRELGYALYDHPDNQGAISVAVPIRSPVGPPQAALVISAVSSRMSPQRQKKIISLLRKEIEPIEKSLVKDRGLFHSEGDQFFKP